VGGIIVVTIIRIVGDPNLNEADKYDEIRNPGDAPVMNRTAFPLQLGDLGPAVADLQVGLRFLIDKRFFGSAVPARMDTESASSSFGAVTRDYVATFRSSSG
jgi:hypothetical protein